MALVLCGCVGASRHGPGGFFAKRATQPDTTASVSPERAEAIADIRAQAEAGQTMPFPDVYQANRTVRLAARDEPRSVADVEAITAELALIAQKRANASSAEEIAALDAHARELRRLAVAAQAGIGK